MLKNIIRELSWKRIVKQNQSSLISGRHRFVACVIVVILVSCATFAYLASCYKQAQDDIVALQRKDACGVRAGLKQQ